MSKLPDSVTEAVASDLEEIAKRDPALARSAQAAAALALARELDGRNSATSKAMCAKALNDTMDRLRELAPAKEEKDKVADINAARAKRRRKAEASG